MEKTVDKQPRRTAFVRQPARVLLVDYSPPFDADTCEYLHDALVNFFSLVTHLSGPCRTPFFGLFALTKFVENLFSLQHVRGNFSRLHSSFRELKLLAKEKSTCPCTPDLILQGLRETAAQFKRQLQSLRQMSTSSCQLEIIFFTCRAAASVTKHIEKFSKSLDLESLKKIQVVMVQSLDEISVEEEDSRSEEDSSPGTEDEGLMGCGLVDVVSLEKDVLSFQNFFKTWLLDCGTDQEHLRLSLPGAFNQDNESDQSQEMVDTGLSLKCDLHECLLDPLHLPYQFNYTVGSESTNLTSKGIAVTKPTVLTYPVYNLAAVKLVKTDAICESVPFIVRPTLCWKLDWEDLESNQQHFHALCSVLNERGVALLAKTSYEPVTLPGVEKPVTPLSPEGHYLFLPSDNNSLLLKSIAVSELMLPNDFQSSVEGPSDSALSAVATCLDQIELSNTYNPLLVHSDLYKALINQSLRNNSSSKPLKRRLQVDQKTQIAHGKHFASRNMQLSAYQQTERATKRTQVRPVVFTAPKEMSVFHDLPQNNEFRSACSVMSTSKRLRQNSASNIYNTSPAAFPDNL